MAAKEKTEDQTLSQMRKGLLEFCTLLIIAKGEVYASDILMELKKADLLVVEGTLYPLLSRLRSEDLLSYRWEESESGPPRKYYSLTEKGRANLQKLRQTWKTLSASIEIINEKP